jgi:O-antigen/teichoic acid export membrane protein
MTAFDKLVVAGTQLALVPILASQWGLALYGQWLLLATLPQFLSMSDFGFATAAGTRMTMATARGDRDEAIHIFQSAWRAILLSGAAMIGLALAAAWFVPDSVFGAAPSAPPHALRLTLAILAIYGVTAVQGSIFFAGFRAAQLFPVGAFWNAMVLLIENAALIVTVLLGGGIVAAASAWLFGRLLGLAGQNWLLRRRVPWLSIGLARGSWGQARALLAPAGAVMLLPIAQALVLQGMALVVGAAAGRAAVPAFAAARTLSRVGMQLCWVVSTPLMPEFSAALARRDGARMAAMIGATLLISALLVVPYALVFMGLGRVMIAVWTHGAIAAPQSLVVAFGFTVLLGGIWYPLSNLVLASDRHAGYSICYVALAVLCLPIGYGLATIFGASGAAGAMAALDGAMLVIVARLARRLFGPHVDREAALSLLRAQVATRMRSRRPRTSR